MSNASSESGLPTRRVMGESDQQNLPSQEQSDIKLTRTELTLIKKLSSQIKEIVSQNARIEHQLHSLNKDIKQITQIHLHKIESRESLKQIQTPAGDTSNKDWKCLWQYGCKYEVKEKEKG